MDGSPHLSSHRERGGEVRSEMERVEKFQLTSSPSSIAPTKTCQDLAIAKLTKEGGSSNHISILNFLCKESSTKRSSIFREGQNFEILTLLSFCQAYSL